MDTRKDGDFLHVDMRAELVRAYLMYQKMMRYPHLIGQMRELFLAALVEKGSLTGSEFDGEVDEILGAERVGPSAACAREVRNALIDLHFASEFSEVEIENYINLARKNDSFRILNRAVNKEGTSPGRIRRVLREFCEIPEGHLHISPSDAVGVRVALINHFISNQLPFVGIAKNHITIRDIDEMLEHFYGNPRRAGKIGGKAAGMLLAYRIILPRLEERDHDLEANVAIPDSFYVSSGVLSDFIDHNRLHQFHAQKYKKPEEIEQEYKQMEELFRSASFPADVMDDFRAFLEQVGEHPLIVRSSSLLEDNFGYAFSGKYESIFLTNQGPLERRLDKFVWGLKRVHMSTFGPAPILYREDHNLLDFDERMSVLVQKVVGRRFGDYFLPFCAGVAYSKNAYTWSRRIRREEGLVRLVMGLGTRAVDRVGLDYPRMIPLSDPLLRPEVEADQIRKYSQKMLDVLNLKTGKIETISFHDLPGIIDHPDLNSAVSIDKDGDLRPPLFNGEVIPADRSCITFQNFLTRTPFVGLMKKILPSLEKAYGHPVDVEFVWDDGKLYILQCRTLAIGVNLEKVTVPGGIPRERILFTNNRGLSNGVMKDIEYLVYVDPKGYGRLPRYEDKSAIRQVVGKLNVRLKGHRYALFGPGRWGSNDINLGVGAGYEDINRALILGEIAFEEKGYTPEVSYGTHFFNDLVEAGVLAVALYPDQKDTVFNEQFFLDSPNEITRIGGESLAPYAASVRVIHVPSCTDGRMLQVYQDGDVQEGLGFFDYPAGTDKPERG